MALAKYGTKWSDIRRETHGQIDDSRSTVDLKDKFRNLTRAGKLDPNDYS